eukprot:8998796-Alexandrium_andersonii.AAC.1
MRLTGLSQSSSISHEHRIPVEALRLGHSQDQLDLSNLGMVGHLTRRIIQLEVAVSQNVRFPDFSGLELVMAPPVGRTGEAAARGFHAWFTKRLGEQANIMKQTRLYREET